ncbi:MAG TPA: carboxypeptidase-like regulatory domain-containing protein, partial [Gemmatimonadaceae bacterium]
MNLRRARVAAALAALVAGGTLHAQDTLVIHGRVIDQSGRPVESASLTLTPGRHPVTSLDGGSFEIRGLGTGVYTLAARHIGFQPASVRVLVRDAVTSVTITLVSVPRELGETPAVAEDIRVRLVDQETRQPLAGLLVAALASDNVVGPAVLSSADGIAAVRLPGAGPSRLYIRRIGFAPVTTSPVAAPAESGAPVEIVVPAHRIVLGTVHVTANVTCARQTASPSAAAEPAWADVRTALEASALTQDQRLVTTAALRFEREVRIDGRVDYVDTTARGRSGERPFVAPSPAALERNGYFKRHDDGSEEFFAPDETVLLSSGFTRTHCINVTSAVRHDSAGGVGSTLVALDFVPRDRDNRSEIKGIIWIDSATNELRRIDFEYVRTPLPAPADSLGGSVTFQHLPTGAWIVSDWLLRVPRWRRVGGIANYVVLDGYLEVGGTASAVRDIATPGPAVPRIIVGTVFDSVAHRPLGGAHVHLADLGREATTDSAGHFRFDSVAPGVHTVWADHAALDSIGLYSLGAQVDATPQVTSNVALTVPSFASLWSRACGAAPVASDSSGFVFGTVHVDGTGPPDSAEGAVTVVIAWRADSARVAHATDSQRQALADSVGNYALCGVPDRRALTLTATRAGGGGTLPASFTLGSSRIARRDIALMSPSRLAAAIDDAARGREGSNVHRLRVLSADGTAVAYANVSLNGGIPIITNEHGEVGLGAGNIRAFVGSVRRIGFSPWFGTIDFPDTTSVVTVSLTALGQRLGDVRITARANPSSPFVQGFYDRWMMRQKGLLSATFIGPEEIEFRHPDFITNLLRGRLGVQIVNPGGEAIFDYAMSSAVPNCQMAVVVDGKQIYPQVDPKTGVAKPIYINQIVEANDIMAIEVYARGGNMPISLQVNDSR